MHNPHETADRSAQPDIVHFDDVVLEACGPERREALMTEAALLAQAFAPEGRAEQLRAMAMTLATGARQEKMDRAHARQLACALRCLARDAET